MDFDNRWFDRCEIQLRVNRKKTSKLSQDEEAHNPTDAVCGVVHVALTARYMCCIMVYEEVGGGEMLNLCMPCLLMVQCLL